MSFIDETDTIHGSPFPGWGGRLFHSERMTFARWTIAGEAADLHEHHHPNEEVWNVVGGEVVLVVDGEERLLRSGSAAVAPPDVRHSVTVVGPRGGGDRSPATVRPARRRGVRR